MGRRSTLRTVLAPYDIGVTEIETAVLLLVGGGAAAIAGELASTGLLAPLDLFFLAMVPVSAVILAVVVARLTLLRALRATL